ncbi:AMP-binding protein, partial [Aquimarina celericrescens]|nr:AMP-binding protein [Aquimarina celericrescens]
GNKTLTYIELEKKSNQLANYLIKEYNIDKEDFVGVHLDKSEQCIVCLLAILKAGAVYVPIDTNYPLDRKQYIIDDANIKVLITNDSYISDIKFFNDSLLVIDSVFDVVNYDLENINYASPNGQAY